MSLISIAPLLVASDAIAIMLATSLASYLCFKRYEPQHPLPLFILLCIIPSALSLLLVPFFSTKSKASIWAFTSYYFLILFYTTTYRLSPLHPLAKFKGPTLAKVSKWWASYVCATGKQHLYYKALHDRYGDIIRVGPNELSIRNAAAIQPVLGTTGLPKGPWWDNRSQPPSLVGQRDPSVHAHRRKPWNRGFTSAALKEYEVIIAKRCRQLQECFEQKVEDVNGGVATVDISAWLSYFTTDFMGDMAFGGGFELMADGGDVKGVWHIFEAGLELAAILGHTSWILSLLNRLPGWQDQIIERMRNFARVNVARRLKLGATRKDLFYHLSDEAGVEPARPPPSVLAADGSLAIIAGSDTTATVLTALLYYLLSDKTAYARLQAEVDSAFPQGEEPLDAVKMAGMEYLNACINEAMRLQPPVPSGSQRSVLRGAGAKVIGQYIIPEETQLFIHTYSVHRDPRNFSPAPDSFLPTRWLTESTEQAHTGSAASHRTGRAYVHNTAAFFPFSFGPTICAGKNLALLEMRMVVCWLLQNFSFAPNEPKMERWEDGVQDFYVVKKPALRVSLSHRQR
ncbi:hypothetical protein HETIRDRAFT_472015 [Heterobasidion irregulare TC 32-1]|uniref:Uncharacterized protein n=1 Tax=Heterobasidion irregulare (strain TC 32-1) TaxID=747525 RepID=W4KD00_HETIT|nr:uncharacterized protein HETIRDRAFT_472015 [Heterobasidion irregulare TC 32-1]ETW83732.1 hypothetical protein HETIRDRAFT_472015 [Heterobasidion irregulare TC 32-1]